MTTRRALFGLFAGALAAPYLPQPPPATPRVVVRVMAFAAQSSWVRYSGYEILDVTLGDLVSAADFEWHRVSAP